MSQAMRDYLEQAYEAERANPEWRYGEALFNTLAASHPQIAEQFRGTELDPFNGMSGRFPKFFQFVRENMKPSEWISVHDRLPEYGVKVVGLDSVNGKQMITQRLFCNRFLGLKDRTKWADYWMPLPEPPEAP